MSDTMFYWIIWFAITSAWSLAKDKSIGEACVRFAGTFIVSLILYFIFIK